MIPKVLHSIWIGGAMPPEYAQCVDSWAATNPGWEVVRWTGAELAQEQLANPWLLDLDHPTVQANLARLEVVRLHGGVYLDSDIECLKPLDALLEGRSAFISMRNKTWFDNCVIAAEQGHPWLEELCAGYGTKQGEIRYVLDMDGLFRDVTEAHPEVVRLPREVMNVSTDPVDDAARADAYAVHRHVGLWRQMDERYLAAKNEG